MSKPFEFPKTKSTLHTVDALHALARILGQSTARWFFHGNIRETTQNIAPNDAGTDS